jgi:Tripartite tricarboxylate transporter family receptor
VVVLALGVSQARAGDYPERAVRIIVPFAAGGTADAIPRLVGDWLSRKWGQPVIIENRTGAGGNIGAEFAYQATPDGYTLLSSPPPPLVINQNLYPKLGFDPTRFEPIIVMAHVPNALIVNPKNIKASSVAELIEYLRNNPEGRRLHEGRGGTVGRGDQGRQYQAGVMGHRFHANVGAGFARDSRARLAVSGNPIERSPGSIACSAGCSSISASASPCSTRAESYGTPRTTSSILIRVKWFSTR